MQQLGRQLQIQINSPAPAFLGGKIEHALSRIIQQAIQSPEMQEVAQSFSTHQGSDMSTSSKKSKACSRTWGENMNDNNDQKSARDTSRGITDTEELMLYHSANKQPLTRRKALKSAYGKYGLWIGTPF